MKDVDPLHRRTQEVDDSGERRRKTDLRERQEEFRLFRDKVLLTIGAVGVIGIALAAVFIKIHDEALALAALTAFATLLGAPTVLRIDEKRRNGS